MPPKKLTAKQDRFVREYMVDLNATQAAIRAGYSKKTAALIGHENLRKPNVKAALAKRQSTKADDIEVTVTRILKEYAAIAFTNMADVATVDESGQFVKFKAFDEWPDAAKQAVQEIKSTTHGLSVKFYDKRSALSDLAKHLGMFIERKVIFDATNAEAEKDSVRSLVKDREIRNAMRLITERIKAGGNAGGSTVH